jgi:hypothetical protein
MATFGVFMTIWNSLWPFGIIYGRLVCIGSVWSFGIYSPFWYVWAKQNLATLGRKMGDAGQKVNGQTERKRKRTACRRKRTKGQTEQHD